MLWKDPNWPKSSQCIAMRNPRINDGTEHVDAFIPKRTAGKVTQEKERDAEKVKDKEKRKVENNRWLNQS